MYSVCVEDVKYHITQRQFTQSLAVILVHIMNRFYNDTSAV